MFLNGGHVLSPDVPPDTLVLPQLPQSGLAVGGGGVGLAVLLLPGLKQSGESMFWSGLEVRSHLPVLQLGLGGWPSQGRLQAEQSKHGQLHHGVVWWVLGTLVVPGRTDGGILWMKVYI